MPGPANISNRIDLEADKAREADAKTIYMERELYRVVARPETERLCRLGDAAEYVFLNAAGRCLTGFKALDRAGNNEGLTVEHRKSL
jgi:hypothetical protein